MINGINLGIWGNNGIRIGVIVGYTHIPIYLRRWFWPLPCTWNCQNPGLLHSTTATFVVLLPLSTATLPSLRRPRCLPCHCLPRFAKCHPWIAGKIIQPNGELASTPRLPTGRENNGGSKRSTREAKMGLITPQLGILLILLAHIHNPWEPWCCYIW